MKIQLGDKVRFLNEVGGGTVSRIEGGKIAYVLDDDGFEIPALLTEIVLVEKKVEQRVEGENDDVASGRYEFEESEEEGEPKVLLACVKSVGMAGNVVMYLINDSNFFVFYTIGKVDDSKIQNKYFGSVEPNTKIELDSLPINVVDGVSYKVQLLLFRKNAIYSDREPVVYDLKLSGAKLLKDGSYLKTGYFDDKAHLIYVLKGTFETKLEELSKKEVEKLIQEKEESPRKLNYKRRDDQAMLEVDLHIHELLDDIKGLSNKEMLGIQMERFHKVMAENAKNKNKKVVFIHGVGNGVLKTEIRKALDRKYKWHSYQDASFKEYGYGATMVSI